jgi:predicted component of type VI protein secretion system
MKIVGLRIITTANQPKGEVIAPDKKEWTMKEVVDYGIAELAVVTKKSVDLDTLENYTTSIF